MHANKMRKLRARGWVVEGPGEFLGLSQEERAMVELRLRLANGLRAERVQRSLTQADLARLIRSSQSRVAKMEAGDPSVSIDLLLRSLIALGSSNADLAKIIAARNAPKGQLRT